MPDHRKDDKSEKVQFRSGSRIFQEQGQWYYHTREGTLEGPYYSKERALESLESYIKMVNSPFRPSSDLKIQDH